MEQGGQVSATADLVGQPGKKINFISKKISNHMEPSQPAFPITGQPFSHNCNPSGPALSTRQNVALGLHIFRDLEETTIKMAAVNIATFNWTNNLCK